MEHTKDKEIKPGSGLDGHICIVIGDLKNKLVKAEQQRDDLLEALKELVLVLENCPGTFNYDPAIEDRAKQAIAKAKD